MAVAYQNHTEIVDTDANNSVTVTVPASLTTNELWVILAATDTDATGVTYTTPSGFAIIGTAFEGESGWPGCACYRKVAGASESNVTLSTTGNDFDAVVYSIRANGNDTTNPIDAVGTPTIGAGNDTTIESPDVTVANNGSLAILFAAAEGAGSVFTAPSGVDTAAVRDSRVSGFPIAAFATQAVNAGSFAPGTWTIDGDTERVAQTFVIAPTGGGGGADPEGSLTGGKLIGGGLLMKGVLVP